MTRKPSMENLALAALLVSVAVLAAYGRVLGNGFLTYDDTEYVTTNAIVRSGLTPAGVGWAFTTTTAYNWHPLTWLSHMLDVEIFGLRPAGHHATSLALHLANTLLLLFVLRRTTGADGPSVFAAALFGVHPLHVESVAWIAERKDVLSTFFLLLALAAHVRFAERPGVARYLAVAAMLAAGLMSKPMPITLPLLLLVVDFWPLGRLGGGRDLMRRAVEKLPLAALAAGSAVLTLAAQHGGGALRSLAELPLGFRVENAVVSAADYLGQTVWPRRLAVFYPHPGGGLAPWRVALAALALVAITAAAVAARRRRPWLSAGWAWFLIALVPVLGIVQVGYQARADRYTYVPSIGLFVAIAWGLDDVLRRVVSPRALRLAAGAVIVALAGVAWHQAGLWQDTETLFRHALRVTSGNWRAHQVLGDLAALRGDLDEAESRYRESLRIRPEQATVRSNLGGLYYREGRYGEALGELRASLRLKPGSSAARNNLGLTLESLGRLDEAVAEYERALAISPDNDALLENLARARARAQSD